MRKPAFQPHWAGGVAALLILAAAAAAPGRADVPAAPKNARALVQELGARAIDALGPSTPKVQRIAVFSELLNKDFDLHDAARFALGRYANDLTPWQQQEFMTLYREALADAYANRLQQYGGQPFQVIGERRIRADETIVDSEVARQNEPPVKIDWQVAARDGRLAVTDVFVDGVSQKLAQREEFSGIIQRNGGQPAAVIAALRQRLQQEQVSTP